MGGGCLRFDELSFRTGETPLLPESPFRMRAKHKGRGGCFAIERVRSMFFRKAIPLSNSNSGTGRPCRATDFATPSWSDDTEQSTGLFISIHT